MQARGVERPARWALFLAPLLPVVLAFNVPPSPTLLGQCLALACWGAVVLSIGAAGASDNTRGDTGAAWPLLSALACVFVAAMAAWVALWSCKLRRRVWNPMRSCMSEAWLAS